ncbi:hypothetical protein BD408DRAFT_423219 [Parasitella parasitica]|nr:hypothetical protein BD408DRAFT_423219 [Parasitella parasitica]
MTHSTSCTFTDNHLAHEKNSLPSPPTSSCGDEREPELITPPPLPSLVSITDYKAADISENYTIDHSKPDAIKQEQYTLKLHKDGHVDASTTRSISPSSLKRSLLSSDEDTSDNDDAAPVAKRKRPTLSETHGCNKCGKLYKHLKSLIKHQWEHSEYWEASSKLSLTKHQQVQLLEAASILTSMKKQHTLNQETDSDSDDYNMDDDEEGEITLL